MSGKASQVTEHGIDRTGNRRRANGDLFSYQPLREEGEGEDAAAALIGTLDLAASWDPLEAFSPATTHAEFPDLSDGLDYHSMSYCNTPEEPFLPAWQAPLSLMSPPHEDVSAQGARSYRSPGQQDGAGVTSAASALGPVPRDAPGWYQPPEDLFTPTHTRSAAAGWKSTHAVAAGAFRDVAAHPPGDSAASSSAYHSYRSALLHKRAHFSQMVSPRPEPGPRRARIDLIHAGHGVSSC